MPPPALAQESIACWIAPVESETPSLTAPKEFAEKMRFAVGWRRAPTSFTQMGRPSARVLNLACAGTDIAQVKRKATNKEHFTSDVFPLVMMRNQPLQTLSGS